MKRDLLDLPFRDLADGVRQLLTWVRKRFFRKTRLRDTLRTPEGLPERSELVCLLVIRKTEIS